MNQNAETPNTPEIDYEQISYGKLGYKRLQRLRRKAQRRGIEVPPLSFELSKPDKPRIAFWIAAIVSLVLLAALLVGLGFLIKYAIDFFNVQFQDTGGLFKTLGNPTVIAGTAGLALLPLLFIILAYLMLFLVMLLPFFLVIYCYRFTRNMFYMARCSKEEFAKGEFILGRIKCFAWILVGATIILICCLSTFETSAAKILIGVIYAGIVIIFGGLLALTLWEKSRCKKWFESLDEEKKQNFLAHEEALRRTKRRLHSERTFWDSFGK